MPDFRRRSFEGGNGSVRINVEDANVAIYGSGSGDPAGGVGGHGNDAEAMPSVGSQRSELLRVPEAHSLVEAPGEKERRSSVAGADPRRRPYGVVVGVLDAIEGG